MNIHIALYKWKPTATSEQINQALKDVEALAQKIPGVLDITTGENTSKYSEGYTHVILVRGKDQAAIDAYRSHPDHTKVAAIIEDMEDKGIGVDFSKENLTDKEDLLTTFMQAYETANNSHIWANVKPMIAPDATYWFTDGSYSGIDEIRQAVKTTFEKLQDEVYKISDLNWPVVTDTIAVCTYRFSWQATISGVKQFGNGRGTNILEKRNGSWQIVHEHLSK